jgi:4-hydroxythreonine-4-phosphate dehydrogenase
VPRLAVTLGDPRGIGPEVVERAVAAAATGVPEVFDLVVLGHDQGVDAFRAAGHEVRGMGPFDGSTESAGQISLDAIRTGVRAIHDGEADALVTGPVHKPALRAAGFEGAGQTELLQELTGAPVVGMLMHAASTRIGDAPLRILLATTHLPLREVPDRITGPLLETQIRLLDRELRNGWAIERPRIGLCGLNPHASDTGLFGDEEARIMAPALERLRDEGIAAEGPFPADTIFLAALDGRLDAVVAPYHDVGMAVFKTLGFGRGVNTTLGLPFPRTSPDHGTAFDLVGTGRARFESTLEALRLADQLARRRLAAGPSA